MKMYKSQRGLELLPVNESDRQVLMELKMTFPERTFFSYDCGENSNEAGLVIINE